MMTLKVDVHPNATSEERVAMVRSVALVSRARQTSIAVQTVAWLGFASFLFWLACAP